MKNLSQEIVNKLIKKNKQISFMESCTGGYLSSQITNVENSSKVLKVGLVTYSNEYKIKFGVSKNVIDEYSVYSIETAKEMANKVSNFANSDYGVGITGELAINSINKVYYAIYSKQKNQYYTYELIAKGNMRVEKKQFLSENIFNNIIDIIEKEG